MNKSKYWVLVGVVMFLVCFFWPLQSLAKAPMLTKAWETTKELRVPESVIFDEITREIYVSNINGKPTVKNAMGFISVLKLDGSIKKLKWVTGMDAPKGMGIWKRTLYVTDIDRVHSISIGRGEIEKTWNVEGARFLNDIAIDKSGAVFISDMTTKTLHRIKDGKLETFANLNYKNPNGLFMSTAGLLVGTAQGMLNVNTQTRTVSIVIEHQGGIDGLKPFKGNQFLVSDWVGKTQMIEKGKSPLMLMDTTAQKINSADFEYIASKKLLLIPTFFDNRVVAYRVK